MATQTRTVRIVVDTKGARDAREQAKAIGEINKAVKDTADAFGALRTITQGLAGATIFGFGIRELATMADTMTLLNSRIQVFVGSVEKTKVVMSELSNIATETKSSISDVAEVFSRIITATARLNISTESQLGLAKVLQQSFRLSGSTAAEATASTIQFAQALSFGQLRGQELRSVLSQNSVLATVFSKAIEGSGKDIYKFAEAGGFTTKFVLKVLAQNFDEIEKKANTLSQTFAQTLTLAMNKFILKVDEINTKFDLNGKFAKGMDLAIEKSDALLVVFTAIATSALPTILTRLTAIASTLSPITAAFAAIGASIVLVIQNLDAIKHDLQEFSLIGQKMFFDLAKSATSAAGVIFGAIGKDVPKFILEARSGIEENLARISRGFNTLEKEAQDFQDKGLKGEGSLLLFRAGIKDINNYAQALSDASDSINTKVLIDFDKLIGELNVKFNKGLIDVQAYNEKLRELTSGKLNEELSKGSISINKFNSELQKLDIEALGRELEYGTISLEDFNLMISAFKIEELEEKFQRGKISAGEFHEELSKINGDNFLAAQSAGEKFIESMGNSANQVAGIVKNAFGTFEEAIFQATKNGKIDFSDFIQSVLDDINRAVIRMTVIAPLVQGISALLNPFGGSFGGASAGSLPVNYTQANGGAWMNGMQMYANGGVVGSPTIFGHSRGLGMMGEKGPEAILPLTRGADGKLGVNSTGNSMTVNIINQTGSEVKTEERTEPGGGRVLDVIIMGKVKEGMMNGYFDQTMSQSWGLKRRGN